MHAAATLAVLCVSLGSALGSDWPQFLGPHGNNSSSEIIRTNWSQQPPRELWRKSIGPGFSSMAVVSGRVFTLARSPGGTEREVCIALDADSGNTVWETDLDRADYSNLSGYDERMDGPRSTPTVEGGRVYASSSQLKFFCLDAATGNVIWQRDFRAEFGSALIPWENAASPLLVGDLILLNSNAPGRRLMALRKSDGVTVWSGEDDGLTHATPVYATLGGVGQVIFLTRQGLVAVVPEDGSVLWRLPFTPSATSTAASPAVVGDHVYASAAYGSGTWMARVIRNGDSFTATQAWRQQGTAYQAHWSTPVAHEAFLYCIPSPTSGQARLACLDVIGGTNRWTQATVGSAAIGYGSLIQAANALIVLTEAGELVLVRPDPGAYSEIASFKTLDRYCWNHVALSNGRVYARNTSQTPEIVALDVSSGEQPLPALEIELTRPAGASANLRLSVRAADRAPLEPSQVDRLEMRFAHDLTLPLGEWPAATEAFTATNGAAIAELPLGPEPSRFLSVREKDQE